MYSTVDSPTGAQISFIFGARSGDFGFWGRALAGLESAIRRRLGRLTVVTVHDFETDDMREWRLCGRPSEEVPRFADSEIVTFYPEVEGKGSLVLTYDGPFMVITIALHCVPDAIEFLQECWREIGSELSAALMGEELEVSEAELVSLIRNCRIPKEADLCEAAIVKTTLGTAGVVVGTEVEYGAVLLRA